MIQFSKTPAAILLAVAMGFGAAAHAQSSSTVNSGAPGAGANAGVIAGGSPDSGAASRQPPSANANVMPRSAEAGGSTEPGRLVRNGGATPAQATNVSGTPDGGRDMRSAPPANSKDRKGKTVGTSGNANLPAGNTPRGAIDQRGNKGPVNTGAPQ